MNTGELYNIFWMRQKTKECSTIFTGLTDEDLAEDYMLLYVEYREEIEIPFDHLVMFLKEIIDTSAAKKGIVAYKVLYKGIVGHVSSGTKFQKIITIKS